MVVAKYLIIALQILFALILIAVVLFQHGSQRGLSGSIAGGAETFFGRNKGRTIDSKLKKWTAVVAILFLVSSISLNLVMQKIDAADAKKAQEAAAKSQTQTQQSAGAQTQTAPQVQTVPNDAKTDEAKTDEAKTDDTKKEEAKTEGTEEAPATDKAEDAKPAE